MAACNSHVKDLVVGVIHKLVPKRGAGRSVPGEGSMRDQVQSEKRYFHS